MNLLLEVILLQKISPINCTPVVKKSLIFLLVGYFAGDAIELLNQYLKYGTYIISGALLLFVAGYFVLGAYLDKKIISQ